jgi:hypothetical protein
MKLRELFKAPIQLDEVSMATGDLQKRYNLKQPVVADQLD